MATTLLKNGTIVNEGRMTESDVLIRAGRIEKIASSISAPPYAEVIDCSGLHILPGVIEELLRCLSGFRYSHETLSANQDDVSLHRDPHGGGIHYR